VPDKYRLVVDRKRARGLAWSRAHTTGNLREIVGRVKHPASLLPTIFVDEFIEIGYGVLERTAYTVAKGDAAVHAPGRLLPDFIGCQRQIQFGKVSYTFFNGPMSDVAALVF
jgi:hypothetical protein